MKIAPLLLALSAVALPFAGCAESSSAPDNNPTSALSIPDKSDNPPVTMSGYVDTGTTARIK